MREITEKNTEGRHKDGKWKKGHCPNPGGRPKGVRTWLLDNTNNLEDVLARLKELANSDRDHVAIKAIQTILDRTEGKPKQSIDANIDGDITFKWEDDDTSDEQ